MRLFGIIIRMLLLVSSFNCSYNMKLSNPLLHDPGDNEINELNELNIRKEYTELEISLSGLISRNEINLNNAPSLFLQFASTYLGRYAENRLFLESQSKIKDIYKSIEWYINGQWHSIPDILYFAQSMEENVTFCINGINAISLDSIDVLEEDSVDYKCIVPKSPDEFIRNKGSGCIRDVDYNIDEEYYPQFWDPTNFNCPVEKQDLNVSIIRMTNKKDITSPDYAEIVKDKSIDCIVFFW